MRHWWSSFVEGMAALGEGMATCFDFGGTLHRSPAADRALERIEEIRARACTQSAEEALASDWEAVGKDFETVLGKERDA